MKWYQPGPVTGPPESPQYSANDTRNAYAPPSPVSEDVYNASFNQDYRQSNPFLAGRNGLDTSEAESRGGMDRDGFQLGQGLQRTWAGLHGTDLRSLLTNGGIGALAGIAGAGTIDAFRTARGKEPWGWKAKLLAGLMGAGAGGLLTHQMRGAKQASTAWLDKSDTLLRVALVQKISQDQDLDLSTRSKITAAIARLGGADLQTLIRVASVAAGAGIGMAVARWLMGKGLISTIAGGMVGGLAGNALSRPRTNAFGRSSLDQYR